MRISLTTNAAGAKVSEVRYKPFGETRWMTGTLATDHLFTGQLAGVCQTSRVSETHEVSCHAYQFVYDPSRRCKCGASHNLSACFWASSSLNSTPSPGAVGTGNPLPCKPS